MQANLTTVIPNSLTRFFTRRTSRQREFIKAAKTVRRFARDVIETRERESCEARVAHADILACILNIAKDDPNFAMEEKIDEVVTFFVAGKSQNKCVCIGRAFKGWGIGWVAGIVGGGGIFMRVAGNNTKILDCFWFNY